MPALPGQIDSLWDKAVADFREGHWKSARKIFERLTLSIPPGDPRGPQSHFFLAECLLAQGENLQATREFRKVSDEHPTDSLAPEALLRAGDAYVELWRRPELDPTYGENAQGVYQELLSRYPGTSAAARAQQRIDDLNERFAYKSYKAALFYYRLKAYDSAILYLKDLLSSYPKTSMAGPALIKLVESYRAIGYQEDLHDTCQYLHQYHPDTPGADEVCPRSAGEPAPPHGP
jgi:outer membrane protein assembly factor BamD